MWWTQCPTSASWSGMYSERRPRLIGRHVCAAVVGAERAGRGDRDEDPPGIARIEDDRVQAHATGTRLPRRPRAVAAQPASSCQLDRRRSSGTARRPRPRRRRCRDRSAKVRGARPARTPRGAASRRTTGASPGPRRSGTVADRLPGLAAVVRALNELPEPPVGLGGVEPIRFDRGPFRWYISQPAKWGPTTSQFSRLPSELSTKAPLRVPTSTRTPAICVPLRCLSGPSPTPDGSRRATRVISPSVQTGRTPQSHRIAGETVPACLGHASGEVRDQAPGLRPAGGT